MASFKKTQLTVSAPGVERGPDATPFPDRGPPPMPYEEALRLAAEEGLALVRHKNTTGFKGVTLSHCSLRSPYQAHSRHKGRKVHLGVFATAWEAALCYARHVGPEQARREAEEAERMGAFGDITPRRLAGPLALLPTTGKGAHAKASSAAEVLAHTPEFKFAVGLPVEGLDGEATKAALTLQTLGSWAPGKLHLPTSSVRVKKRPLNQTMQIILGAKQQVGVDTSALLTSTASSRFPFYVEDHSAETLLACSMDQLRVAVVVADAPQIFVHY